MKKVYSKSKPLVKVTFSISAEALNGSKNAVVLGDFNGWVAEEGVPLKKQKDGLYKASLDLETGKEFQYKFFVDGTTWVLDAEADGTVTGPFGEPNSVLSTVAA